MHHIRMYIVSVTNDDSHLSYVMMMMMMLMIIIMIMIRPQALNSLAHVHTEHT